MPVSYTQYTPARAKRRDVLLLNIKLLDECVITTLVFSLKVLEVHTAVSHHTEKSASGMDILRVLLEVCRKFVDAAGKEANLDLRRTSISVAAGNFLDDVQLLLFRKHMYTVAHIVAVCKSPVGNKSKQQVRALWSRTIHQPLTVCNYARYRKSGPPKEGPLCGLDG